MSRKHAATRHENQVTTYAHSTSSPFTQKQPQIRPLNSPTKQPPKNVQLKQSAAKLKQQLTVNSLGQTSIEANQSKNPREHLAVGYGTNQLQIV